jgi:hypothetical protein
LPDLLGVRPVRSELIYLLVSLDKQFTAEAPGEPWEVYYARQITALRAAPSNGPTLTRPNATARATASAGLKFSGGSVSDLSTV